MSSDVHVNRPTVYSRYLPIAAAMYTARAIQASGPRRAFELAALIKRANSCPGWVRAGSTPAVAIPKAEDCSMKFGLWSANIGPWAALELAKAGEATGFESIWAAEHSIFPREYASRYPYSADGKAPVAR